MRFGSLLTAAAALMLLTGTLTAGEKKLMHCFAFTPIETATEAEWKAFYAATDQLPSKIPGISKVWAGKLVRPLNQFAIADPEAAKKLREGGKDVPAAKVNRNVRAYGVCMEMAGEDALKAYPTAPYHKEWMAAYEKVRVAGTTTFDIIGQ